MFFKFLEKYNSKLNGKLQEGDAYFSLTPLLLLKAVFKE